MTQSESSVFFARRCRSAIAAIAAAVALVAGQTPAGAQSPTRVANSNGAGVDMHLFRPAVDSKGFFTVNGADILGANDISVGLVLDYGHGLLRLNPGHGLDAKDDAKYMLEHAFQGTFQFDYGIADLLVLGISAPIVLNGGEALKDIGPGYPNNYDADKFSAQALGNLALNAKFRILPPDGPIGLALIAQAGFGIGGTRNFAADPGFFYWPQAVIERRFGSLVRIGVNVGYRGHFRENTKFGVSADQKTPVLKAGNFEYSDLLTSSLGLSVRVLPILDLTAETYTSFQLGGATSAAKQRLSAEALGGIKLFIERNSYFMLAGGFGYTDGFQAAAQRATLGFIFEPSIGDRDGDGIKDDQDNCPDDPEDFDGFQDTRSDSPPGKYGCPDPDNDEDGIPDKEDRCPNDPEDKDGTEDDDGCPEANAGDRDGDGILDARDKCPDDPEDKDGFQDQDGCPDPDNDKDGIPDKEDRCPLEPEDKDGFEDADGCPDPDNDKDGIADVKDRCPDQPETFNGFEDEDGCPDKGKVIIENNNILILDKILFKTGSAEILQESFSIVDAVATTLTHHPEFTLVEVQGHADERGNNNMNLRLTQDRSNSVVEALVKKGVERKSLRPMGYGPYCPIDPAHGPEAWEKNRRVEFKVVSTSTGPTGVELGCEGARAKGVAPPKP
jgi:OOP family OmpA-OmpF porin